MPSHDKKVLRENDKMIKMIKESDVDRVGISHRFIYQIYGSLVLEDPYREDHMPRAHLCTTKNLVDLANVSQVGLGFPTFE